MSHSGDVILICKSVNCLMSVVLKILIKKSYLCHLSENNVSLFYCICFALRLSPSGCRSVCRFVDTRRCPLLRLASAGEKFGFVTQSNRVTSPWRNEAAALPTECKQLSEGYFGDISQQTVADPANAPS